MKKVLYILVIFFALPFTGYTQNEKTISNKEETSFKNQIDLDVQFLGVDFLYKRRLGKKLFLGAGFGGGTIVSFSNRGIILEILESKIILDYQLSDRIHFYSGPKFCPLILTENNRFGSYIFGFEVGLLFNTKKIEFGIKLSFIDFNVSSGSSRGLLTIVPLVVKIPLGKW